MRKWIKACVCPVLILILLTSGCMARPAPVREVPLASETAAVSETDTRVDTTEPAAEASAQPASEKPTEAATEAPAEATEELTEATTEAPTETATEELVEAATEASAEATAESTGTALTEAPAEIIADESAAESVPDRVDAGKDYVINKNTKKFHIPSCSSVSDIKDSNRWDYHGTREEIMEMGYIPCKRCNP